MVINHMELTRALDIISLPFLIVPTILILIDFFLTHLRFHSERKKLLKDNLSLFQSILEYEIGAPSDEDINDLLNKLKQKSNYISQSHYQQILLGYKKVTHLCKLLRRQKDNRDNDEILRLKEELAYVIETVQGD